MEFMQSQLVGLVELYISEQPKYKVAQALARFATCCQPPSHSFRFYHLPNTIIFSSTYHSNTTLSTHHSSQPHNHLRPSSSLLVPTALSSPVPTCRTVAPSVSSHRLPPSYDTVINHGLVLSLQCPPSPDGITSQQPRS